MSGGVAIALGPCYCCDQVFLFNPDKVPSYENQPICEPCISLVNRKRADLGLEQFHIFPDSYGPIEAGAL